jgi:hypothetical protein
MTKGCQEEIDAIRADLALMKRVINEAEGKSEEALLQAATAKAQVATLTARLENLVITDGRKQ